MTDTTRDPKAAEVHRRNAEGAWIHYLRTGNPAALEESKTQDEIAYMLETGTEPPKKGAA